jgi:iron complex transport system ATP-binding protein
MSRVLYPQKGMVLFEGKDITKIGLKKLCQKIAFVPQDTLISFSFTVWEIVLMGRIPHLKRFQFETKKDFLIAQNSLRLTDTVGLREKSIDQLSAGERQRVVISKALAQEPNLLFLDEPTSHLDIGHQIRILDLLKGINREKGLTVVVVLHDLNLASEYCERLILLNNGRIFRDGKPDEVLTYRNIEEVYKTTVLVNTNPKSLKPHVMLISNIEQCVQNYS